MFKEKSDSPVPSPGASEAAPLEQRFGSGLDAQPPVQGEIGFVGLGHMGTAMAANLAATGFRMIAYVRRPDQMDKLAALGLKPTMDIIELFLASGLMPGAIHLLPRQKTRAPRCHR